jgi:hypothetical protein
MAQWSEQRDATAFEKILDASFGIDALPSWFPAEAFAATIRRSLPEVEPADEDSSASTTRTSTDWRPDCYGWPSLEPVT